MYEEILKSHPYPIDAMNNMNNIFYLVYAAVSIYFITYVYCIWDSEYMKSYYIDCCLNTKSFGALALRTIIFCLFSQ